MKNRKSNLRSILTISVALAAVGLSGCFGGGGKGHVSKPFLQPWYDVWGNKCGSGDPAPGCNFYGNGLKIIDVEDTYFFSSYDLEWGEWWYYDSFGFFQIYKGWAWLSPSGILYDDFGFALNEEEEESSRDVIADVAKEEQALLKEVAQDFSEEYSLEAGVGMKVAQTLNDFMRIRLDRSRSDADLKAISKRLYGVSFDEGKRAVLAALSGDQSGLKTLNKRIARSWKTTSANSERILRNWYDRELEEFEKAEDEVEEETEE